MHTLALAKRYPQRLSRAFRLLCNSVTKIPHGRTRSRRVKQPIPRCCRLADKTRLPAHVINCCTDVKTQNINLPGLLLPCACARRRRWLKADAGALGRWCLAGKASIVSSGALCQVAILVHLAPDDIRPTARDNHGPFLAHGQTHGHCGCVAGHGSHSVLITECQIVHAADVSTHATVVMNARCKFSSVDPPKACKKCVNSIPCGARAYTIVLYMIQTALCTHLRLFVVVDGHRTYKHAQKDYN